MSAIKYSIYLSMGMLLLIICGQACQSRTGPSTAQTIASTDTRIVAPVSSDLIEAPASNQLSLSNATLAKPKRIVQQKEKNIIKLPVKSKELRTSKIIQPGKDGVPLPNRRALHPKRVLAGTPSITKAQLPKKLEHTEAGMLSFLREQGLIDPVVLNFYQDKDGNLWGTTLYGGFFKYDGQYFSHYTTAQGLPSNAMRSIIFENDGSIIISSLAGIVIYDGKYFTIIDKEAGLADNVTLGISKDQDGYLWIGSWGGLYRVDPSLDMLTEFTIEHGLTSNTVGRILVDQYNQVWIGNTAVNVMKMQGPAESPEFQILHFDHKILETSFLNAIYEDTVRNEMWTSLVDGLVRFSQIDESSSFLTKMDYIEYHELETPIEMIQSIIKASEGRYLMPTRNGLWEMSYGTSAADWVVEESFSNEYFTNIFEDDTGAVWFSNWDSEGTKGVTKANLKSFSSLKEKLNYPGAVSDITEDNNGNLWLGTSEHGLLQYKRNGVLNQIAKQKGSADFEISEVLAEDINTIWTVNYRNGISKYKKQANGDWKVTDISEEQGLLNNFTTSLQLDNSADLWLSSFESSDQPLSGISNIRDTSVLNYSIDQGLSHEDIMAYSYDSVSNNHWLATWGQGLTVMNLDEGKDQGKFYHLSVENGLSDNIIRFIFNDSKGNAWVSGRGGYGLQKISFDKHRGEFIFKTYAEENGLSSNYAVAAVETPNHDIWIGTNNGINRLVYNDETESHDNIVSYAEQDGFPHKVCLANAMHYGSDSLIYVSTKEDVIYFDPDDLEFNDQFNSPYLMSVLIDGYAMDWKKDTSIIVLESGRVVDDISYDSLALWTGLPINLSVSPDNKFIGFEFSSTQINNPQKVSYQYRLSGAEELWNKVTTQNSVNYGPLPHGKYNFQVRSKLSLGPWSDTASFPFTIRTPFYLSTPAIILYSVFLLWLAYLYSRYQVNRNTSKLKQIEQVRLKISSDIHDDVGSLLTGLTMQSELMAMSKDTVKDQKGLQEISKSGRLAIERLRDIVWALDARRDKYENLLDRMKHFADSKFRSTQIDYVFEIGDFEQTTFISPDRRQNIYMIFKESITNILKHSNANMVKVSFLKSGGKVHLSIYDNGRANTDSVKSDGLGLDNMKMRADAIGATLSFDRSEGFEVLLVL